MELVSKEHEYSIDVILTNQPKMFYTAQTFELGVSDCHKMVSTCLRSKIPRIRTKNIFYRSLKNYDKDKFLKELSEKLNATNFSNDVDNSYDNLINSLVINLDKFAPLKKKKVRGNQSRFMNKELSKAIMKRSHLKSKYLRSPTNLNRTNFKKQRNLCVTLKRKAIKEDFEKSTINLKKNSKKFYDLIKPYLTNKGALCSNDIVLFENNQLVTQEEKLTEIFNEYYINIVKYSSGKEPENIADTLEFGSTVDQIITKIINIHKNHPSIKLIKKYTKNASQFAFKPTNETEILKLLKSIDCKKAIGTDSIPPKIIKDSANILVKPFTKIINLCIKENKFPTKAKIAEVLPIFKKDERQQKGNYRPISILNTLSKIIERIMKDQIMNHMDNLLSPYVSAYRKNYGSQHVLIRLLEEWRQGLDEGDLVGGILMDLSKAFDCIPHDLLIAKLHCYGFDKYALSLIYSYLKGRRQCVKINGIKSKFLTLVAGVPQGSIL